MHLAADAAPRGGFATPDLVAALKGAQFEAPQGRVAIDGDTQHTSLWPRIARVNARREFEIIYAARARCGRCRTW